MDVPDLWRIALCPVALVQASNVVQPTEDDGHPYLSGNREELEFPRRIRRYLPLFVPHLVSPADPKY